MIFSDLDEPERLGIYRSWHWLQVATDDLDPVYPVYRDLIKREGLSPDEAAMLVLLHVAYYHSGSALVALQEFRSGVLPPLDLPCSTERRGHRDRAKLALHLRSMLGATADGAHAWLTEPTTWRGMQDRYLTLYGNGRWAAYKLGEMVQKILGHPVVIPDAGHPNSTGPRKGLADLFPGLPTDSGAISVAALDATTNTVAEFLGETDIAQVETSLCDFHSLVKGGYYLGHDIDEMQAQLLAVPCDLTWSVMSSRLATLPHAYLGELHGRLGVSTVRNSAFRTTGEILERH
jgi:Alpha-glutamyl/putrescinyl thymine pyrophosphorylase clade 2